MSHWEPAPSQMTGAQLLLHFLGGTGNPPAPTLGRAEAGCWPCAHRQ